MRSIEWIVLLILLNSMERKSPIYTHESTSSSDSGDLKKIILREFSLYHKVLKTFQSHSVAISHRVGCRSLSLKACMPTSVVPQTCKEYPCVTIQCGHNSCNPNRFGPSGRRGIFQATEQRAAKTKCRRKISSFAAPTSYGIVLTPVL
jgi:hypothetical protein